MSVATGRRVLSTVMIGLLSGAELAHAQLPLNIEELLVAPRTINLQTLFAYTIVDQALPLLFADGTGSGGSLPPAAEHQTRAATALTRIRYGLHQDIEVNASFAHTQVDWQQPGFAGGGNEHAATLGANWRVSADAETPALLLTAGVDVLETSWQVPQARWYGRTLRVGAQTYRALDPVVLSLALLYEWRRERDIGQVRYDPGDILRLQPQVNFAVNHRVTLIGGLSWQYAQADRAGGLRTAVSRYQTDVSFGIGLQTGPGSVLFVDTRVATSGGRGASVALDWHYQF
ncbi:MAG: hypothetical protein NWR64_07130 [Haliea sp.]|nr:hypothetical protein [Haliea sp.]